ncbi:MAG: glycosyltransferase family 4 protein [Vicinamibacteria bacterium]
MRIGIDARELQGRPTGVGRYLRNLIGAWTRTTGDSLVLYLNGPAPKDPVLDHPLVETRALGDAPTRGLLWQERRLPRAAARDQLDVFFAPAYSCPLSLGLPRVTTVHDMSFFSIPDDFTVADAFRRRLLVGMSLRVSRHVIAVSDFTRREVLSHLPDLSGRVTAILHGADGEASPAPPREAAREALAIRGPLLVSVGSILNRRRLPTLLRAVRLLTKSHPRIVLDVVGENRTHPLLDLAALVADLDLQAHVRLSGFVTEEELRARYAAADVAVYLSEYEGFGLPVIEAMARGLPVVTSARAATGELFAGAALLADPGDAGAVAEAIGQVLDDPARAAALVASGRALVSRLTWAKAAAATRDVLLNAAAIR